MGTFHGFYTASRPDKPPWFLADGGDPAIGIIYQQPLKKSKGRPLFPGGLNSRITRSYSDCCE
jgi:hypothetical protein